MWHDDESVVVEKNLFQISMKAAAWDVHFFKLQTKFNHANIYGNLSKKELLILCKELTLNKKTFLLSDQ